MDASPGLSKADLSEHEQELILEVRDLQRRVANLEEHVGIVVPVSTSVATSHPAALPKLNVSAEAVPIIGKALLGIAGAYLLRALTELGVLPQTPGVAVGILYAILWLWVAARLPAERKLAITVNGLTSVLILAPLLWEATIRFHAISSRTTAATIAAFFLIGQALSWRKNLTVIFGIASVFSALIAMALLIATNDLLPFTLSLLVIAGGVEFAAYRDRAPGPRWLVAAMADLAVVIFSALISRKEGLPEGYVSASLPSALIAQGLLLIIYVASIGSRTLVYHRLFTSVEIAQMAFAFLIGLGGAFQIVKRDSTATSALALFTLVCALACYVISLVFLGRERNRNFYVYGTFAFLFVLAGSFPLFSGLALVTVWSAWALVCCWAGLRAKQQMLGLHGAVLLLLTSLVSGVVLQPAAQLFGVGDASVLWFASGIVVLAAFFSYLAVVLHSPNRVAAFLISANLTWAVAGMAAWGLNATWRAVEGGPGKTIPGATFGTAALLVLSVVIAWSGVKWQRPELIWLVYAFMAVAAGKLLMLDLRLTSTLPLVVSLLLYGGTLIVLPRILRQRKML